MRKYKSSFDTRDNEPYVALAFIAAMLLTIIITGWGAYYAGVKQGHRDYKNAPDGKCILYSLPDDGLALDN